MEDIRAKQRLEEKLGRRVSDHEVYSLTANMEAAGAAPMEEQPAEPVKPLGKTTKRVLLVGFAALLIGVTLFFAGASMSERTYNSLNPFAPKPPQGAFPDAIGGYRKASELYYNDSRSIGYGYKFNAIYKSPDGKSVDYTVIDYGSPEKVKERVQGTDYLGSGGKVVQREDGRMVANDPYNGGTIISLAAGPRMIMVKSKRPADAIEFENQLPYAALGVGQPQIREYGSRAGGK